MNGKNGWSSFHTLVNAAIVLTVLVAFGAGDALAAGPPGFDTLGWNINKGDRALDAAAAVHSDLARGFIRAEAFSFDDFIACGGDEKAVKDAGKFRLEGRDYVVKDGDMICIRFNV